MTIWKYEIPANPMPTIQMPQGSSILTVQVQNGKACLWALVNPDNKLVDRIIKIYGTGHPGTPSRETYVGSFQIAIASSSSSFVFHVFDGGESE